MMVGEKLPAYPVAVDTGDWEPGLRVRRVSVANQANMGQGTRQIGHWASSSAGPSSVNWTTLPSPICSIQGARCQPVHVCMSLSAALPVAEFAFIHVLLPLDGLLAGVVLGLVLRLRMAGLLGLQELHTSKEQGRDVQSRIALP